MWPFNTGGCLIELTTWAGLTIELVKLKKYHIIGTYPKTTRQIVNTETKPITWPLTTYHMTAYIIALVQAL